MPLGNNISRNIKELYKDNTLKGKARGANGTPRPRKQIIAIAIQAAHKGGLKHSHKGNSAVYKRK